MYLWTLEGTKAQRQTAREALQSVTFPFRKIRQTIPSPRIRFRDLSKWGAGPPQAEAGMASAPHHSLEGEGHAFWHPKRAGAWGLFFHDGRIAIEQELSEEDAKLTIIAELAHTIDVFFMSDFMRTRISSLMPDSRGIWWGGEYYGQDAEAWMSMFVRAYSPFYMYWPRIIKDEAIRRVPAVLGVEPVKAPQKQWPIWLPNWLR